VCRKDERISGQAVDCTSKLITVKVYRRVRTTRLRGSKERTGRGEELFNLAGYIAGKGDGELV